MCINYIETNEKISHINLNDDILNEDMNNNLNLNNNKQNNEKIANENSNTLNNIIYRKYTELPYTSKDNNYDKDKKLEYYKEFEDSLLKIKREREIHCIDEKNNSIIFENKLSFSLENGTNRIIFYGDGYQYFSNLKQNNKFKEHDTVLQNKIDIDDLIEKEIYNL